MGGDVLCFVQFIHPGPEAMPRHGLVPWNLTVDPHRRKFLLGPGWFTRSPQEPPVAGQLMFWGEWEAPSRHRPARAAGEGFPRTVASPYFRNPSSYEGLHNTDPFVFGDAFRYTNCKQWRSAGPGQLRYMARGSVILFGSHLEGRFVLDTVLVVRDYLDHSVATFDSGELERRVGQPYFDVTFRPTYLDPKNRARDFRLYEGATPEVSVDGMFSFFPCQPAEAGDGFGRPSIDLAKFVTPMLSQGQRLNKGVTPSQIRTLWAAVVDQVLDEGLCLGVRAELPPSES